MTFQRLLPLAIFIFMGSVKAEPFAVLEHSLRNSTPDKIAENITSRTNEKLEMEQLLQLYKLLDNEEVATKISSKVKLQDIAVVILSHVSEIKPQEGTYKVKAIISHKVKDKTFRYHIPNLSKPSMKVFKRKVRDWIMKKYPA